MKNFKYTFRPSNTFWETGFYLKDKERGQYRYTGRWGLVKQGAVNGGLPQPYGYGPENVQDCVLNLPFTMFAQIEESFFEFMDNLFRVHDDEYDFKDDCMLLPYALADFLPAIFTTIAAVTAAIWLPIYAIQSGYSSDCPEFGDMALLLSPLIAVAGALLGAWELLAATLMFVKAGIEVGFSAINIALSPLKAIGGCIADMLDRSEEDINSTSSLQKT